MATKQEVKNCFVDLAEAQGRMLAVISSTDTGYTPENRAFIAGLIDGATGVMRHLKDAIMKLS